MRRLSSSSSSITKFGDIHVTNNTIVTKDDLIPKSTLLEGSKFPSEINHHLRWLAQKYNMRQDACLIGHPTSIRRNLIIKFCEEVGLEVEFLSITRDTVSSDLTQRREILGTSILFVDQAVVRAAKLGRVLILDGLEKAERNVLPTLNNLLENREMNLDDGSMLISSKTYNDIIKSGVKSTQLIPVSDNFWVVSLVSPTPPYISTTSISLDPPLRSRFQCRYIDELKTDTLISLFNQKYIIDDRFTKVMSLYESLNSLRNTVLNDDNDSSLSLLPIFSLKNVYDTMNIIKKGNTAEKAIQKCILPLNLISKYLPDKYKSRIEQIYDTYNLNNMSTSSEIKDTTLFPEQSRILSDMKLDNTLHRHVLIVGDKGIGKSYLANAFSKDFKGCHIMQMYSELSSRDLLQRRVTDDQGNSQWKDSPLTTATRNGDLVILDGIERLDTSGLSVIKRLLNDNTIELPNGERIYAHKDFRLLALTLPPKSTNEYRDRYLQSDLPFSVSYINSDKMIEDKLHQLSSSSSSSSLYKIAKAFTKSDSEFKLSLKNISALERMLQRHSALNSDSSNLMSMLGMGNGTANNDKFLIEKIEDMLMVKYLPSSSLKKFNTIMASLNLQTSSKESKIKTSSSSSSSLSSANIHPEIVENGKYVKIDNVKVLRNTNPSNPEKVPRPLYHDNYTHSKLLKQLVLNSFSDGQQETVLIIGAQGVGKNKIVDRLLQLLNREKEYIQLHRDSTISTLTVLPTLIDGKIKFEDSPLVKAVKNGRVLVVDEVDKASPELIFVLKTLAENQDIYLGDGRRIISSGSSNIVRKNENDIIRHPHFRLILLANPGVYPFHGNDFFKSCGDSFIPFVMNELDMGSEISLLKSFGPNVDVKIIADIALTFMDLRNDYKNGTISYPFSTRESVSVIKHLEQYSHDGISSAIDNVLSFDSLNPSLQNLILSKFKERGIPISKDHEKRIMEWEIVKERSMMNKSDPRTAIGSPKHGKLDPNNKPHVGGNTWAGGTGGSDTAGLGGRGGPYRLDLGHDVHQVSDKAKQEVSDKVKQEAARLAKEGLLNRLQEIKMQKFEYNAYMMFKKKIENETKQLRDILMSNKNINERSWLRNQSSGEIDDNKLVDGILGEKNIYKKRSPPDSPDSKRFNKNKVSSNNKTKKRFHFIIDVSASMYRFNGMDHRLERMIEVVLLIIESMPHDSELYDYAITGHSGDSSQIEFINWGKSKPKNEKDRFEILQSMIAHSQYCLAGDYTLKATSKGIQNLQNELRDDNDVEGYTFIFSDANFERYDISVSAIKKAMNSNDHRINSFLILIASMEEEANRIVKELPVNTAHTCFNSNDLPILFKNILLETLK